MQEVGLKTNRLPAISYWLRVPPPPHYRSGYRKNQGHICCTQSLPYPFLSLAGRRVQDCCTNSVCFGPIASLSMCPNGCEDCPSQLPCHVPACCGIIGLALDVKMDLLGRHNARLGKPNGPPIYRGKKLLLGFPNNFLRPRTHLGKPCARCAAGGRKRLLLALSGPQAAQAPVLEWNLRQAS